MKIANLFPCLLTLALFSPRGVLGICAWNQHDNCFCDYVGWLPATTLELNTGGSTSCSGSGGCYPHICPNVLTQGTCESTGLLCNEWIRATRPSHFSGEGWLTHFQVTLPEAETSNGLETWFYTSGANTSCLRHYSGAIKHGTGVWNTVAIAPGRSAELNKGQKFVEWTTPGGQKLSGTATEVRCL